LFHSHFYNQHLYDTISGLWKDRSGRSPAIASVPLSGSREQLQVRFEELSSTYLRYFPPDGRLRKTQHEHLPICPVDREIELRARAYSTF